MRLVKTRNTGVHETHEIQWKKGEGADAYTLSDLTKAEQTRLENFTKQNLDMPILKPHTPSRPQLFLPTDGGNVVRATAASAAANDQAGPDNKKARVFNSALTLMGVDHGVPKSREPTPGRFYKRDVAEPPQVHTPRRRLRI
jgi:hypothetical protein